MSIRPWLDAVRHRLGLRSNGRRAVGRQDHRAIAGQTTEALEPRCLLTVSGFLLNGTDLNIVMNSNDTVQVQADASGFVQVRTGGGTTVVPIAQIQASALTSINIQGSDSANSIDLSAITSAEFSASLGITVHGGDAADTIIGSALADNLFGDNGADSISDSAGANTLSGGDGNDTITGGTDNDSILGGDGLDNIVGNDGADTLNGGNGADSISGGLGNDSILAGSGQDTANGDTGDDIVNGEDGNDSLMGSDGNDVFFGGIGNDTVSGGDGLDTISGNAGDDVLGGDAGNDSINGDDGNDSITGGDDDDFINGNAGNDTAIGDLGDDTLLGGNGNDRLDGSSGNDSLSGQGGNDALQGGLGADSLDGGAGNDVLRGDPPLISVADVVVAEGGTVNVTVSISEPSDVDVSFDFQTVVETASISDFVAINGRMTIPAGKSSVSILVTTTQDSITETNEIFALEVLNVTNAFLGYGEGDITILDNDYTAPRVDLAPSAVTVIEGDIGFTVTTLTVTLLDPSPTPVTISVLTADGRALANQDYVSINSTLTFLVDPATGFAQGSQTIFVSVIGDTLVGGDDDFTVNIALVSGNVNIVNSQTTVTIQSDDLGPVNLSVDPVNVTELDAGQFSQANFLVQLTNAQGQPQGFDSDQQINAFTTDGVGATAALATSDYTAINRSLTISVGATSLAVPVTVVGDALGENAESFDLNINSTSPFVNIVSGRATATIATSDGGSGGGGGVITIRRIRIIFFWATALTESNGETGDQSPESSSNPSSDFDFDLQFADSVPAEVRQEVVGASQFWRQIIKSDIPDVSLFDGTLIDDLRLLTEVVPLDGPGGALAGAAITGVRNDSQLPFTATIQIDSADVARLRSDGSLRDVLKHELAHALGFGSLWQSLGLLTVDGYRGRHGVDEFNQLFGSNVGAIPLSVDNGHWSEGLLGNELMTPIIDGANLPVSSLTIAQFADLGYGVDLTRANNSRLTRPTSRGTGLVSAGQFLASGIGNQDVITGGDGNDTIYGGMDNDTINGMAGNDSLDGGLGNDSLLGGAGADTLTGDEGDDTLDGQNGNDVVAGGDGEDTYVWNGAGDGVDTLSSISGYDRVRVNGNGGSNNYTVSQVSGQVKVTDGSASITVASVIQVIEINGGGGDDTINVQALDRVGTATLLTINGDAGSDTITAAGMKLGLVYLALNGGAGNDSLTSGNGNDTLDGGEGNDRLDGGLGNDLLLGGLGVDRLIGGDGNDTAFGGDDQDSISGGNGDDSLSGEVGADTIEGGSGNDTIDGGLAADTLRGDAGNDSLLGGNDADSLLGGAGNDSLIGGGSDDTLSGEIGNDKIFGEDGNDSISGGDGDDTLNGGDGDDTLSGDLGNDLIGGANGSDFLNGGAGNDTLTGGDGNDTLLGGANNDVLLGDEGDDVLNGQGGTDTLTPGEGNDTVADAAELNTSYVLAAALEAALAMI